MDSFAYASAACFCAAVALSSADCAAATSFFACWTFDCFCERSAVAVSTALAALSAFACAAVMASSFAVLSDCALSSALSAFSLASVLASRVALALSAAFFALFAFVCLSAKSFSAWLFAVEACSAVWRVDSTALAASCAACSAAATFAGSEASCAACLTVSRFCSAVFNASCALESLPWASDRAVSAASADFWAVCTSLPNFAVSSPAVALAVSSAVRCAASLSCCALCTADWAVVSAACA